MNMLIHEHHEKVANKMYAAAMAMKEWKNGVGPNIEREVIENIESARGCRGVPRGGGLVAVHTIRGSLSVDIVRHECTCKAWQMSGIPCRHACAAIKACHLNVYDYVDDFFKLSSQEKIYSKCMIPVVTIDKPDPNNYLLLNITSLPLLKPPKTRPKGGRPRTKRIESQFQKKKIYNCSYCHKPGHTRRSCRNPNPR